MNGRRPTKELRALTGAEGDAGPDRRVRRRPWSLRTRLTVTVLALLVAGLFAVPFATWAVVRDAGAERARERLTTFAADLTPLLADGRTLALGGDGEAMLRALGRAGGPSFVQVHTADGRPVQTVALDGSPPIDGPVTARPWWPGPRTAGSPDGARFAREGPGRDGGPFPGASDWWLRGSWLPDGRVLVVGTRTDEYDAFNGRLTGVHFAITVAALVTLAVIAYRAIRRALLPLDRIAATAKAIGDGDLTRRVEPADPHSEAGRLGLALNAMLGQIEAAFREREASEERLRRFIADASHELRTPVATVRGYAELFRRGAAERPADLAKTMDRIESEARRMGVLVDELLLLARLDQGRPLDRAPLDLTGLAADAVAAARAVDPERPLTLHAGTPLPVQGDAVRLRQLLDNLLANVRDHTPPGTPATVTLRAEHDSAVIEVRDEGPGIPADHAPHVFDRFYRADPARSRTGGGTGLGLAIVAAIAQAHGGTAALRPGGPGATFEIRLPLDVRSAQPMAGRSGPAPPGEPDAHA
ncbi:hypothetical protein GCM10010106_32170 [Thermopolyspora flexuosa]|jgi:two-component system OmpR family sensor kinase|uniref:histidine kinase n=1 Tax=Thermopolyspora flexuosa TaxID=103836 RepID=A0A543ISV9_9ACTN|nr:HAMP domain-containing sensor histidine kinase [Thermopolyspora flexuosa]TQM73660.1 two-component system OmpR family sensor kinase [Thermopolyspora flexuosa]GGM83066.1 hypothetical protein GCM10010106_32170 [Thermopolyspora flexuosa]